jgi:hypothetical protein
MYKTDTVTYTDHKGHTAILERMSHTLTDARERYAQLLAYGNLTQRDAYCEAFGKAIETEAQKDKVDQCASRMAHDTDVILRVQELRKPLVRKLRRKFEYTIQKALEQCETAWALAYATADAKSMLAAIRMQAELSKLLAQQIDVNHRYGLLDDASTETLLAMRKEIEVRQGKQKKLRQIEARNVETVVVEGAETSFLVT